MRILGSVALVAWFLAACGGPEATAPTADNQVSRGGKLYAAKCASCHGDKGEGGGPVPAVVGKQALPKLKTADELAAYVQKNMPPPNGGLTDSELWDIVAFDLHANGIEAKQVDATTAKSIALH